MGERRGTKALELWCRRMTEGYPGVKIDNMTTSWRDGLAFCAMIHHFRPDLIEFDKLNKSDVYYNNELAFTTAEKYLGIPALLDADDMATYEVPDRLSILTYLSQFYQVFAAQDSSNRLKRPSPSTTAEKTQISKTPGPPPKMAHVVGVPRRDPCQKCQLPVFLAERLTVGKKVYHRTCLKCARCGSQLTPGSFYETEVDGEYCCETCPDEEEQQDVASNSVLLRHGLQDDQTTADTSASSRTVRSSIADRLAFFEQSKAGNESGNKLLQKSVSDEEKSKSLQRMEVTTATAATATAPTLSPYKLNSALSSFLNDTLDSAKDESSPAATDDDSKSELATQMDTSDSDNDDTDADTDADRSLEQSAPSLPQTQPPTLLAEPVPNKRFTATAQLQLVSTPPAEEVSLTKPSAEIEPKVEEESGANTLKTELLEPAKLNDNDTRFNDSKNNNGHKDHTTIEADVKLDTAEESTIIESNTAQQVQMQESREINLDLGATNVNDHVTKDKIADTNEIAVAQVQTLSDVENIEQIKTELQSLEAESSTDKESSPGEQIVELRTKSLKPEIEQKPKPLSHPEDAATTERLSVVRARLQQFEVIANNRNNNNASPDKDTTSVNVNPNDNIKLSEIEIESKSNVKLNNEDSISPSTTLKESFDEIDQIDEEERTPTKNLEDEVKLKAMEIDISTETSKTEEQNMQTAIEVPTPAKEKDNSLNVEENKPEIKEMEVEEEKSTPTPIPIPKPAARITRIEQKEETNTKHTPTKITAEEYPEDLNPFKSDEEDEEDDNKENIQQQPTAAAGKSGMEKKRNSANPFDSSDDEIELEKSKSSRTSTASSTPSGKVPPPRPPPPRISRNPFGDDNDEEQQQFSRHSSATSSLTKKTPVPTPRTNVDLYGSVNSLGSATPASMQRNGDVRGSNNSLTSSAGGTIRLRKARKAPAPPAPPVKELFPSPEAGNSSKGSTPSSSTVGTPKLGRKKRPAPAPPKPARLDSSLVPQLALERESNGTASKNLLSYPLQGESDSKLSDEEKALLEGKRLPHVGTDDDSVSRRSTRRMIPLDKSLLDDADDESGGGGGSKSDDLKQQQQQEKQLRYDEEHETQVVYRRMLVPPPMDTPTRETNPLLDELLGDAHDRQLEKMKDNKEAKNRNRQSQISASSGNEDCDASAPYNKSSYGKWKRRKGPAPALPVPPRKVLQMLPLQEIRHELEIIEVQQQGLEKQGVILEKMIRDRCEGQNGELLNDSKAGEDTNDGGTKPNSKEVEDLILQLFELVNEKNELFRRQAELMYLRRQHRLEQEQADLEYEIRVLMAQPERNKTDTDKAREEALIARLVDVVQLRNEVVECLEMDRLREAEEDLSIKQSLELHTAHREEITDSKKTPAKLSKKEKKKQKEAKKLSKAKKLDADKDADETELNADKQKLKKKKKKFLF